MGVQVELQDILAGYLSAAGHTANNTLIEAALDKSLDRTGTTNNAMEVDLDMATNRIINLPDAISNQEPATYSQLLELTTFPVSDSDARHFDTTTAAKADNTVELGDLAIIQDRGYTKWDVVLTTAVTPDDYTVVQSVAQPNLSFQLRVENIVNALAVGLDNTGATDDTARWVALETAAAGRTIYIPKGTYLKDRTFVPSNTNYSFDPGVVVNGTTGGNNTWRFSNCNDSHFYGNGATFNRDATGTSHNIYFEIAERCSLINCNVINGGAAKDCIYVGGGAFGTFSKQILISGGSAQNGNRNCISVVSAQDTIIENMEIFGATGAPGSGIDLEANEYEMCYRTTVRNCKIHDNASFGVVSVFSDVAWIYNNYIYDNTNSGIATAAGGVQFDSINSGQGRDVYRTQDLRGVGSFDTVNGWVGVTAGSQESDIGLEVGQVVQFRLLNGATLPPEFQTQTRWIVAEKAAGGNNSVRLEEYFEYNKVTSLTNAGTGTLTLDADTSDIQMICYAEGQSSNFFIYDNFLENNGTEDIDISTSVNFVIRDNIIKSGDDRTLGFRVQYSRNGDISGNKIYMDQNTVVSATGLSLGQCSNVNTRENEIYYSASRGLTVDGCSRGRYIDDLIVNCGRISNEAMRLQFGSGAKISPVIRQDTKNTPTYGLRLYNTVSNSLVTGADLTTAGTSNANSLTDNGTGNRIVDTRLNDGTFAP